jgi:hypothetical protein
MWQAFTQLEALSQWRMIEDSLHRMAKQKAHPTRHSEFNAVCKLLEEKVIEADVHSAQVSVHRSQMGRGGGPSCFFGVK